MKDYYFILGISRKAGSSEIKEAFRRLCLKYHPDITPTNQHNEERYMEICEAHKVLSNKEKREIYDRKLMGPAEHNGLKEELGKIKDAIYPEIKTSYKGHYPWLAAFAVIIVGVIALIFSFGRSRVSYVADPQPAAEIKMPVTPTTKTASPPALADTVQSTVIAIDTPKTIISQPDTAEKTESYIVSALKQHTPTQISKVTAAGAKAPGVIHYKEKNYNYEFRDKKLIVTFVSDFGKKSKRNKIVIPAKDIETVYYYNNKIWISNRKKSIQVYDLGSGKKYNTEFFSVKFDTDNAAEMEYKLAEAFQQLKDLYRL